MQWQYSIWTISFKYEYYETSKVVFLQILHRFLFILDGKACWDLATVLHVYISHSQYIYDGWQFWTQSFQIYPLEWPPPPPPSQPLRIGGAGGGWTSKTDKQTDNTGGSAGRVFPISENSALSSAIPSLSYYTLIFPTLAENRLELLVY